MSMIASSSRKATARRLGLATLLSTLLVATSSAPAQETDSPEVSEPAVPALATDTGEPQATDGLSTNSVTTTNSTQQLAEDPPADDPPPDPPPTTPTPLGPAPPTGKLAWNVRVLAPVYARATPSLSAKKVMLVQPIAPFTHGPTVLLVLDHKLVNGVTWTKVLLPKRPNGAAGWVRADYLRFWKQRTRVLIDQSSRRTIVYRDGQVVLSVRNAVGKPETPTPNGYFAVAEKAYLPSWNFLGPVVLVTTGHSEVLNEYAGGNGRFALHGTSQPWVIGTRASHGCIRHTNTNIQRISKIVGLGTPIRIRN